MLFCYRSVVLVPNSLLLKSANAIMLNYPPEELITLTMATRLNLYASYLE